jgi:hypothetical protein
MTELETGSSIFDNNLGIDSLFETVESNKEQSSIEETLSEKDSLFGGISKESEKKGSDDDIDDVNTGLFDDEEETRTSYKQEETEEDEKESGTGVTPYGEAISTLIANTDNFLVYEGDEADKKDYSRDEFVELFNHNINAKSQQIVEQTFEQIMTSLSPTAQRLITGELNGVKIKDIIADVAEYQEIEEIPENPSDSEKEKIVKTYYKRLAKDRGKDIEWVSKQLEKVIDRGDLDSEFEDARDVIQKDLDEKIAKKEQEIQVKRQEKEEFKKYHTYFVREALNEDNLFGLRLTPTEKNQVAGVLSTFAVRPSDKKEKLGITAMIDNFIYSENPKESYKILALMALAGSAPDKLIEKLRATAEKKVSNETIKKLKVADKVTPLNTQNVEKKPKKLGSIFN